ncbi:MAG: histidyl-tRNA synthetase [Miltoncostaeaceae bacterium]|nr:histidyl-tRNA synthetase [Miltoncostaeaceae bacterium]
MKVAAPRGTRDVLPAEWRVRRRILDVASEAFAAYGYAPITTPTFEDTEVFVRGVGTSTDIVRKEMYTLADGERSITLRPEGTAPVARAFVQHGMHKLPAPVKLWYLAPMFRHEAPQAGRYREHYQLGAEALGSDDPLLDAEVIGLLADLYRRLGVPDVRLRIGSMGDAATREPYRDRLLAYLRTHAADLTEDARERMEQNPMRLFDMKEPRVAEVMREAPKLLESLGPEAEAHYRRALAGLDALGIAYEEDPYLVRGLDYYTHTVFEFTCDRLGAQSGIGGGGRYDGLIESLGGQPTPGIGFGTGVERITLALGGAEEAPPASLDVYLAVPDDDLRLRLMPLLARLRAAGLRCDSDLRGRSLKAMMRHASSLGAARVVIVGPRDHAAGVATVRDMATGDERAVPLDRLEDELT